jgi:hypothetical protein
LNNVFNEIYSYIAENASRKRKNGADESLPSKEIHALERSCSSVLSCCSRLPILLAMISENPPRTQQIRAIKPKTSTSADKRPHPRWTRSMDDKRAAPPDTSPNRREILPLMSRAAWSSLKKVFIARP